MLEEKRRKKTVTNPGVPGCASRSVELVCVVKKRQR
jgi:hypothetical protein